MTDTGGRNDIVWIPGGTFRMGSDKHYPEEASVHRVSVDGFWIDRTSVTNRQFREFVGATGYITIAEIAPHPDDCPGVLPHMEWTGDWYSAKHEAEADKACCIPTNHR